MELGLHSIMDAGLLHFTVKLSCGPEREIFPIVTKRTLSAVSVLTMSSVQHELLNKR